MRISDWSSDVCSSDLASRAKKAVAAEAAAEPATAGEAEPVAAAADGEGEGPDGEPRRGWWQPTYGNSGGPNKHPRVPPTEYQVRSSPDAHCPCGARSTRYTSLSSSLKISPHTHCLPPSQEHAHFFLRR